MHLSSFIAPSVVAALSVNLAAQAAPAPQLLPLSLSEPTLAHDATQRVFGLSSTFSEPQPDSDVSPLDDAPSDFVDVLLSEASLAVEDAASKDVHQKDGPSPGGWVWKSCGEETDAVEVKSVEVSPDPPKPGQNLTVTASGIVKSRIEAGTYADVVVKLGLIKLLTRRFDVCEEAKKNDAEIQCPVEAGEYKITQTVALPREIPPAKFNVHVNGATQDEQNLLCLDLSIDFLNRRRFT